ncbi:MAG: efflux RND transporter permease subunit [Verrucomicrobiales bacterium]|nr:efflux RND transporter permease subunit [Verrucomicrobiales bacterium]
MSGGSEDNPKDHSFIRWFVGNPVVANLFMIVILVWGIQNAFSLRKEAFPTFSPESVSVFVPFNGGVPEDVERGVSIKIEEALQGVDGVDHIRSTSTDSSANVIVEAVEDYPITKLLDDVKIQVDAISTFPEQAENPVITENEQRQSVMWIEVSGDVSETVLKETARSVRDELLKQPDIDTVDTEGARDYEISVEVSEEKLRTFNLTFNEVASAVSANSIDLSGGLLRSPRGDISLRARSQAYNAADFRKLPLRISNSGARIFLGDVADVRDGFVDQKYLHRFDGKPSVSLQITTDGKKDIINAVTQAVELIEHYESRFGLPEGVTLTAWKDGSEPIRSRLQLLTRNGIQGVILVLISLSLFLNLRLAFWVAIGIPVSIAGALILFPVSSIDLSINMITAFSFIVVLGLIVDDAIVIGESVFSEKEDPENSGLSEDDQTVKGVARVVTPATFGVLTTIAAFYPLTQVSGMLGNVFGQIATGVIFCLIFSLVESKFILPSHLAHIKVNQRPRNFIGRGWKKFQGTIANGLQWSVENWYRPVLKFSLKFRYVTLAIFIGGLIVVVSLLPAGILRFVFFPIYLPMTSP